MAVGDVYMLKDHQEVGGNLVLNVYFYRALTAGLVAENLENGFNSTLMPYITGAQTSNLAHTRVEVVNLFDSADYQDVAVAANGGIAVSTPELMPNFVAAPIRINRQRADMRHGYKRYAGIHEDAITGNGWNNLHAQYTALTALATALALSFDNPVGAPVDWEPVIVKRIKYLAPTGKYAWRLPTSQGELQYYPVVSCSLRAPTTQVTRKLN